MTGKRIGYIRTSTIDQNTARQLDGVPLDKVFEDKLSGKDRNRPQLKLCLEFLREGDTLVIHSLDRLGRNVRDLLDIVGELTTKGVTVSFLHPSLSFSGDDSPINKLLFLLMAGFAEMERNLILERIKEGVALAKRCETCKKTRAEHGSQSHPFTNKYRGRAPAIRSNNGKLETLEQMAAEGKGVAEMARTAGVSRQTVYSWLAKRAAAMSEERQAAA
jgi:DNA invertase Pin-like site-specific DNA recombinase